MSSKQAGRRSRATRSRLVMRRLSRACNSRSTSKPTRSSKVSSLIAGFSICSIRPWAMAFSFRATSLSIVGWFNMEILLVVVAGAPDVFVVRVWRGGGDGDDGLAVEALYQDAQDAL